ncbi:MAG: hypothetical protein IJH98_08340 [Solobacterium sp.]|nr:hypothetical protein [Solobacterium sp.]
MSEMEKTTAVPLPEYPRMQLQRDSFINLNGIWQYQITDGRAPEEEDWKEILVPYPLGSELSGSKEELHPHEVLWYRRRFTFEQSRKHVLLNFEAVDQCCTVYLNDKKIGEHAGGYTPFAYDVTKYIKYNNELVVIVTDDTDRGLYAYGKQKLEHSGMWYTPTAGIWQTVWIEEVGDKAVTDLKITPDCDHSCVYLDMAGTYEQAIINVFADGVLVHRGITVEHSYTVQLDSVRYWSPEDPFLYDLYIETGEETVKSYFGMRKFSAGTDKYNVRRFMLNGRPLFLSGLLDQGYTWEGLVTYPDEAMMVKELEAIKDMGFNMLRKHAKTECRRWYWLCDRMGILVMQDIPNGGGPYSFMSTGILPNLGRIRTKDNDYKAAGRETKESRDAYYYEVDEILNALYNCVSIFAWVAFNEGWGQFDSAAATEYIKRYDTTRLVDSASGWFDQGAGDFLSRHCYFLPFKVPQEDGRIILLSEFGGYSFLEKGHSKVDKLYGYRKYKDKGKLNKAISDLYNRMVYENIPKGLSGCIYTQVSDVEDECNGLFTFDRKVLKVDRRMMKKINDRLIRRVK